ncbi:uncharacterized protein B0I36DRAFT_370347 [Microdochium trichocladiopsis]|uniref:Uncharacterized protein n=1 Tax=Microdochium trichocladiopsis TaxID=1682393 RepID=A0A9P8XRK1_9PEZI|nr:uncharacterized protein B0I36DRAFT_370347 [Microdochium trichocladiopsis]KAH7009408.1 hypothetical protein B0I36DRAFT_370347 [Microdochium trichocladiopsis]
MNGVNDTGAEVWRSDASTDVASLLADEPGINAKPSLLDDHSMRYAPESFPESSRLEAPTSNRHEQLDTDASDDHNSETTSSTSGTISELEQLLVQEGQGSASGGRAPRPSSSNSHATTQSAFDSSTSSLSFEQNTVSPQLSDGGLHVRFMNAFRGW